jgi:nucleotide-binding universal stress UspA family protein
MKAQKILLNTDFSACARQAYPQVAALARRMEAHIDLVHCVEYPAQYSPAGFASVDAALQNFHRIQRDSLERECKDPIFGGLAVEPRLLDGYPFQAIQDFARRNSIDLIAQSSHGHTGLKRLLLGSFAEQVLRSSIVPVLTIRSQEAKNGKAQESFEPRRILFPYDFSLNSRKALEAVRFFAGAYSARLLVLHVWRDALDLSPLGTQGGSGDQELVAISGEYRDRLARDLKEFSSRELVGLEHQEQVLRGEPASVILAQAVIFEADLICMATHGFTGLQRMVMGSVAEKVLRTGHCPCLTIRP